MVYVSSFYGAEETPILGFLSSSKCWGDRKSIPLSNQSRHCHHHQPSPGRTQLTEKCKLAWTRKTPEAAPPPSRSQTGLSVTLESYPFPSNPDDPVQHRALCSNLCAKWLPARGTGPLQTISQFYKHLCRLTSYTPFIYFNKHREEHCCCSVAQSCLTLYDPIDYSMPGFPVLHYLPELAQTHPIQWVMPSNRLILCRPPPPPPPSPAFNLSQHQALLQ